MLKDTPEEIWKNSWRENLWFRTLIFTSIFQHLTIKNFLKMKALWDSWYFTEPRWVWAQSIAHEVNGKTAFYFHKCRIKSVPPTIPLRCRRSIRQQVAYLGCFWGTLVAVQAALYPKTNCLPSLPLHLLCEQAIVRQRKKNLAIIAYFFRHFKMCFPEEHCV